jgi:hypothetical protein
MASPADRDAPLSDGPAQGAGTGVRGAYQHPAGSEAGPDHLAGRRRVLPRQIAKRVGISEEYVATWRRRFGDAGLDGLGDAPGRGRRRKFGRDNPVRIVATATSASPERASDRWHASWPNARPRTVWRSPPLRSGGSAPMWT